MARKKITINLKGGDAVTANGDLKFQFHDADSSDAFILTANYAAIGSKNTPGTDAANLTFTQDDAANNGDGQMIIDGVDVGTATNLKVRVMDEIGNESDLSAAVSSGFVIDIAKANSQAIVIPGAKMAVGLDLEIVFHTVAETSTGKYFMGTGESSNNNGHVSLKNQYSAKSLILFTRDINGSVMANGLDFSDGNPHTYRIVVVDADTIQIYLDGVYDSDRSLTSMDWAGNTGDICIGAYNDAGALGGDCQIDSFTIDGEHFACNEGSGATTTGDQGTVATLLNNPQWIAK